MELVNELIDFLSVVIFLVFYNQLHQWFAITLSFLKLTQNRLITSFFMHIFNYDFYGIIEFFFGLHIKSCWYSAKMMSCHKIIFSYCSFLFGQSLQLYSISIRDQITQTLQTSDLEGP